MTESQPRITPLQVEKKTFRTRMKGYDRAEVEEFLGDVSAEMERLIGRIRSVEAAQTESAAQVQRFQEMEGTLKEALVLAQKTADETRASAHREADAVLAETRQKCREMAVEAEHRTQAMRDDLGRMQADRNSVVMQLKALVDSFATRLMELVPVPTVAVSMAAPPSEATERTGEVDDVTRALEER